MSKENNKKFILITIIIIIVFSAINATNRSDNNVNDSQVEDVEAEDTKIEEVEEVKEKKKFTKEELAKEKMAAIGELYKVYSTNNAPFNILGMDKYEKFKFKLDGEDININNVIVVTYLSNQNQFQKLFKDEMFFYLLDEYGNEYYPDVYSRNSKELHEYEIILALSDEYGEELYPGLSVDDCKYLIISSLSEWSFNGRRKLLYEIMTEEEHNNKIMEEIEKNEELEDENKNINEELNKRIEEITNYK